MPAVEDVLRDGNVTGSLVQISTLMRSFDARHRHHLNHVLVTLYALAERLRDDEDARMDFCRHPAWASVKRNRPRVDRSAFMFRHALRFANGLADEAGSKRASKQFRALGPFFDEGVPHTEIGQRLKAQGGIDGLAKAHAKPRTPRQAKKEPRLRINPGASTTFLDNQRTGQDLLIQLKVTDVKDGVVHADIVRAGRPKYKKTQ